jgi:NADPH-dependent 2,4-dienoyl-CoA reductase/sulfur reductase-like enzyme
MGVHLLHSMGDTFALMSTLEKTGPASAVIVGLHRLGDGRGADRQGAGGHPAGATTRGTPHRGPALGALVHGDLTGHGVDVLASTAVEAIEAAPAGSAGRLHVHTRRADSAAVSRFADVVLVVTGVRRDTGLAASAGARLGFKNAIEVDRRMRTGLPAVFAAGDCAVTWHRLAGVTYLPLGTTAHKQGRVAGENALGGQREFAGSLGTQVVKIFEHAAARTGLRDHEAAAAGFEPFTAAHEADDHKAYYPGSHRIQMRFTGDRRTGRLLGVQLFGHQHAEVAKRIDIAGAAIFAGLTVEQISDLDLSYTPPLGSPWDAVQAGAQEWVRAAAAGTPPSGG